MKIKINNGGGIPRIKPVERKMVFENPDFCEEKEYRAIIFVEARLDHSKGTQFKYRLTLDDVSMAVEPQYPSTLYDEITDERAHLLALAEAVMDLRRRVFISNEHPTDLVGCNLHIVSSHKEFLAAIKWLMNAPDTGTGIVSPEMFDLLRQSVSIETHLISSEDADAVKTSAGFTIDEPEESRA